MKKRKDKDFTIEQQKEVCRLFDFLMFKTFVEYSYLKTEQQDKRKQTPTNI